MNNEKVKLGEIVIENFKSFKGIHRIKLFGCQAVVGKEDSGKSNFVHAISFVLGEFIEDHNEALLLIHGAPVGKPVKPCSVSARLEFYENGGHRAAVAEYKRVILNDRIAHFVDGEEESEMAYVISFRNVKIDMRSAVYTVINENSILGILNSSPKKLMKYFDKIFRTDIFKEECKTLKRKITDIKSEIEHLKLLISSRKLSEKDQSNLDKNKKLMKSLETRRKTLFLMKLYYLEKDIEELENNLESKKQDLSTFQNVEKEMTQDVKRHELELLQLLENVTEVEKKLGEVKTNALLSRQQQVEAFSQQINDADTRTENFLQHEQEKRKHVTTAWKEKISDLKNQLNHLQQEKVTLSSDIKELSLSNEQWERYILLLKEYTKESTDLVTKFSEILRYKHNCDEEIVALQLQRDPLESVLELKRKKLNLIVKLSSKSKKRIQDGRDEIKKLQFEVGAMEEKLETDKAKKRKLNDDVEELEDRFNSVENDKEQRAKRQRTIDVIEALRMHFEGVFGRLGDLCKAKSERYHIAVDRALSDYKNAIVVNSKKTALKCQQYILSAKMESQTFLPIDDLETLDLKDAPPNSSFIIKAMKFHQQFQKAVLHVVKNTLVCETKVDADNVWSHLKPETLRERRQHDIIVLDGTLYHKDDYVSPPLKNWQPLNEDEVEELKRQMKRKESEYHNYLKRHLVSVSDTEYQIRVLRSKIKDQENLINSEQEEFNKESDSAKEIEDEILKLQSEIKILNDKIKSISESPEYIEGLDVNKQLSDLKQKVFIDFCQEIGVDSFEEFEDIQKKFHRQEKRHQCENEISKVESLLKSELQKKPLAEDQVEERFKENATKLRENLEKLKNEPLVLTNPRLEKQLEELKNLLTQNENLSENIREKLAKVSETKLNALQEIGNFEKLINLKKAECDKLLVESFSYDLGLLKKNQDGSSDFSEVMRNINYKNLPIHLKKLDSQEARATEVADLEVKIASLEGELNVLSTRIIGSSRYLLQATTEKNEEWQAKLVELEEDLYATTEDFNSCQLRRDNIFSHKLNDIFEGLKAIYRWIYGETAEIFLCKKDFAEKLDDVEEDGIDEEINFLFVLPGKKACKFTDLAFRDKFLATAVLLFAGSLGTGFPLIIIDEIDNHLDDTTVKRLAKVFKNMTVRCQLLVVSNNVEVYSLFETMLGILSEIDSSGISCSAAIANDLSEYPE